MHSSTIEPITNSKDLSEILWTIVLFCLDINNQYLSVFFLLFGFFGNIFSMVIFFSQRHGDKATAGYLGPLAFFDCWNVCIGIFYWLVGGALKATNGAFGFSSYGESDVNCWLLVFFMFFGMYMSGYILVLFSLERCLVVWFPLKMSTLLTRRRRRYAILSLLAMAPVFTITVVSEPGGFIDDPVSPRWCPVKPDTPLFLKIWYWFVPIGVGTEMPVIFVVILNVLILVGVRRTGREISGQTETARKNEMRCLKNLLLVSIFFVIFLFPFGIFFGAAAFRVPLGVVVHTLTLCSLQWASLNYCINPLLYCYTLPYYRESALKLLTCGLYSVRKNDWTTTNSK